MMYVMMARLIAKNYQKDKFSSHLSSAKDKENQLTVVNRERQIIISDHSDISEPEIKRRNVAFFHSMISLVKHLVKYPFYDYL